MSDSVISVENLGKKYKIHHQVERQRYVALRDVLSQKLFAPFKFLRRSLKIADGLGARATRPPLSAARRKLSQPGHSTGRRLEATGTVALPTRPKIFGRFAT